MNVLEDDVLELIQRIKIGTNAEAFLRTDLGGYMVERMGVLRQQSLDRLEQANPYDAQAMAIAQNEARIPLMVLQAISDCIEEYKSAEKYLNQPPE